MSVASVSSSPGIIHLKKTNGNLKSQKYYFGGDALFYGNACGARVLRTFLNSCEHK